MPTAPLAPAASLAPSGSTLSQSPDWVTFGHDLQRTNQQISTGGITRQSVAGLVLLWTYASSAAYDTAGPIESNGIVYAADYNGDVVALDARSGALLWKRRLNAEIKMTPALLDGRLFIGTYVDKTASAQSAFYALDPKTGSVVWQRSINGGMHGSPVAIGGRVYVPVSIGDPGFCHPGGVYVFDEVTGAPGFQWLTDSNSSSDGGAIWSSVTYDGNRILFGSGNTCRNSSSTANAVVSIATDTTFLWADQTASPLSDDDVGGTVSEQNGIAFVSGKNGKTYAIDPKTGSIRWVQSLGAPDFDGGFSTPALTNSTLVVSGGFPADPELSNPNIAQFGTLYGLNPATGSPLWKITATSPFWAPAATTPDLAFTSVDKSVQALDPATGKVAWSSPVADVSRAQPAIAGGEVFAVDESGYVYAFGFPTVANADLRRRSAEALASLPKSRGERFFSRTPPYCKL